MPVLGAGGVLELRRELPPPVVVSPDAVRLHVNAFDLSEDGYWTGDKVWIWGPKGLPFDFDGDGRPDVIGGFGMFFGSKLGLYGPRAARLTSGASKWFGPEAPFQSPPRDNLTDRLELYIFRDSLDRISFYLDLEDALEGGAQGRLVPFPVDFGLILIAPAGATGYQQRLEPAYPALTAFRFDPGDTERRVEQITDAVIPEPVGDDNDRPWYFIAEMEDWALELSAKEVDTTSLGEAFGESTRALITGGGTANFFLNRYENGPQRDATFLARLMILLEQGCKAEASFRVTTAAPEYELKTAQRRLPRSDVFYKAELILTKNAVNTRADDLIRGTANFVTVGRVKLVIS
jgi:hypothetical protein